MKTADEIVEAIFDDLRDRRFLKWLFDESGEGLIDYFRDGSPLKALDLEVQQEIKDAWCKIIAAALAAPASAADADNIIAWFGTNGTEWRRKDNGSPVDMPVREYRPVRAPVSAAEPTIIDRIEDLIAEFGEQSLPMIGDAIGEWRQAAPASAAERDMSATQIADAVIDWMIKHRLADYGEELSAADIIETLDGMVMQ